MAHGCRRTSRSSAISESKKPHFTLHSSIAIFGPNAIWALSQYIPVSSIAAAAVCRSCAAQMIARCICAQCVRRWAACTGPIPWIEQRLLASFQSATFSSAIFSCQVHFGCGRRYMCVWRTCRTVRWYAISWCREKSLLRNALTELRAVHHWFRIGHTWMVQELGEKLIQLLINCLIYVSVFGCVFWFDFGHLKAFFCCLAGLKMVFTAVTMVYTFTRHPFKKQTGHGHFAFGMWGRHLMRPGFDAYAFKKVCTPF